MTHTGQLMMHGPLTIAQAERAQEINAHSSASYGERVIRIAEAMPPLTEEQLSHLAVLLHP